MSYVEWRDGPIGRNYWSGYPTICSPGSMVQKSGQIAVKDNSVYSYRGPIEEISVGSKRRRIFRSLHLRKYETLTDPSTMVWCPGSFNLAGIDIAQFQMHALWDYWRRKINRTYYEGSKWPVYGSSGMSEFGESHRSELPRDLYVKLKEPRYDLGVFLGELAETLVSIQGLFKGCLLALTKTRKSIRNLKHLILNPEEMWLWYRYFLLPTMLDAEELIKAIKPMSSIDRIQTGGPSQKSITTGTVLSRGWSGGAVWEIPWQQTLTWRCGGALDLTKRYDPNPWGMSVRDAARVGWELVPFSFVVDWFVGVGDWLTTLRDIEYEIAQSYVTYAVESRLELLPGTNVDQDINPIIREVAVNRLIDIEPPPYPLINNEWFNAMRVVDSISLLTGILKGILRDNFRGRKKRRRRRR